ncbi:MAG TPA: DUF4368 domain-containing protein [Candidatus Avidehalobacter gallistercoris]|uniref:DUF4368 domain-containing protein n=1 Tax=Candidatus Avidehalobacter gallistercoris TaxID=2840694 RepID=A0A9D1KY22_9FIRM|nr:DUF4368 domain-containing protein [Candidatus Avidehalobacter gallistercoris]
MIRRNIIYPVRSALMEIRVLHILLAVTREKIRTDKEYVGIRELIPTIVNEFVKKIIVRAPEKYIEYR